MHELPVTESILEISLRHANEAGAKRINSINIRIGEYASIVDDSVQFYWDIISKDTIAEKAILNFDRVPAEFICLECNNKFIPRADQFSCPLCGSSKVKLTKGNEFYLESIDVE